MKIVVDPIGMTWSIDEPGDFQAMSVVSVAPASPADLSRALGTLGRVDGEHAWLDVSELEHALDLDAAGSAGFAGMLRYAASAGWTSPDGREVRAHIE